MLQVILSDWLVRGFLLYLLLAGCAALLRRGRSAAPSPFGFLYLAGIGEKWNRRGAAYLVPREGWRDHHLISGDPVGRSVLVTRGMANDRGLGYA